jgi:hypothetical protein
MISSDGLTTARILEVFREEIAGFGGSVTDTVHDDLRLFTRSILPRVEEVRRQDQVQGGVALKALGTEVWLHPYVFRLVCRNGAIMAQAIQTQHLGDLHLREGDEAEFLVREAIRGCCAEEAFTTAVQQMRSAREIQADLGLNLLPLLARFPSSQTGPLLRQILEQFGREADPSRFGLMNAVTAVARDTRDPDLRWNLEELGGGIPAGVGPKPLPRDVAARRVHCHGELVLARNRTASFMTP